MALIEINIPEEDGYQDELAGRILLVMVAAGLFMMAFRFWSGVSQTTSLTLGALSFILMALGTQLLVFSVSGIDLEAHGRQLAIAVTVTMLLATIAALLATGSSWIPRAATDVILFSSYAIDVILDGASPYSVSMAPAAEMFSAEQVTRFWTDRIDGSRVQSFSYPAGAALAFVPQAALVGRGPVGIRLTSLVAVGLTGTFAAVILPARLAMAAPASLVIGRNQFITHAGGVIDMVWVAPFVVALWLWADDRLVSAAVAIGVAASIKQFAWIAIPFLAVWVIRKHGSKASAKTAVAGSATFGLINLPWILMSPVDWLAGVFTPLAASGAPLEVAGSGLAAIHVASAFPRPVFTIAVVTVFAASLLAYWLWLDKLLWVAWVAPPLVLLWHSRSLMSYFVSFIPVAVLAAAASKDRLRSPQEVFANGI